MRAVLNILLTSTIFFGINTQCGASMPVSTVPRPVQSFATLPHQYLGTKAQTVQEAFEQRATLFLKGRNFKPWLLNKPKNDILKEFDQINEWRYHAWYVDPNAKTLISRADFMVAQALLEKGYYQQPNLIAFEYNLTDPTYNSSTIIINGFHFLALEAPNARSLRNFFTLLQNFHVTQLVRLSIAGERRSDKNFPYWTGKLKREPKSQGNTLNVPQPFNPSPYPVRYYYSDKWSDNSSNTNELLKLIQAARKEHEPGTDVLACHCHNDKGQTGTFLAGFLLLSEIDRQIASGVAKQSLNISIEKIVMQLSLQRPYMVAEPEQYVILYRLVDSYVQSLK